MAPYTQLFINNEYVDAHSGETLTIYNPHDESLVADNIQVANQQDVDAAVAAARAAFKGEWSTWTAAKRATVMLKLADIIERDANMIAELESKSMGQPMSVAGFVMQLVPKAFRYYAGWTDKIPGESWPEEDGTYSIVQYEPVGVCAGIGAWNATPIFFGAKIAPAVATGCTFVFKASEKSPLATLQFGAMVKEAGFPPGVINIVTGDGRVGGALASHMDINKISFTGSGFAGKKVQEAAAKSNLKRVTLELGGKSPSIIFEDADIENALVNTSQNFLFNTGQACVAASRTFLHESIADKFVEQLKARFNGFAQAMGDPSNPNTFLGPLVDKKQFERVMEFLEAGKGEAQLITGGGRHGNSGFYVEPTIFLNPGDNAKIYREEIFGPVITLRTFKTEEEAIALANDTQYGLSACVFTSSVSRALRVASKIESGMVNVNSAQGFRMETPFGGSKQSGTGREFGRQGIMHYLEPKTIAINMKV